MPATRREEGKDRPLLTFAVFSYNHERFIREAVAGAFAQTWSPLQIILTDDCSSDRSFEIMSGMAASYRGPHEIVLNRNPRNLGRNGSVNRAWAAGPGQKTPGPPGRAAAGAGGGSGGPRARGRGGGDAGQIFGDAITIDAEGRELGRWFGGRVPPYARTLEEAVARGTVGIAGCTHMFSRKCFDVLGPLEGSDSAKDVTVSFRALFLGEILYLDEPLVRYRIHGGNISVESGKRPTLAFRTRQAGYHENAYSSWLHDTRIAEQKGLISGERAERIRKSLYLKQYWLAVGKEYYRSGGIRGLRTLLSAACEAGSIAPALKLMDRKRRSRS
jgi:glycosyltransferase involved in cell wall biosynthesis